jgi:hypothetical protein
LGRAVGDALKDLKAVGTVRAEDGALGVVAAVASEKISPGRPGWPANAWAFLAAALDVPASDANAIVDIVVVAALVECGTEHTSEADLSTLAKSPPVASCSSWRAAQSSCTQFWGMPRAPLGGTTTME